MSLAAPPDFAREQKVLRLLIEQTAGSVLAFALYNNRVDRDRVIAWLRDKATLPVNTFTLSSEFDDPTTVVNDAAPTPRQCFAFTDVEAAFPRFLGYVNFHREELLRAGHALVFWIREEGMRRIAEEAPDFWAWRSRVFDFRARETTAPAPSLPSQPTEVRSYSFADLERQASSLAGSAPDDFVGQLALGRRELALLHYTEADQALKLALQTAQQTGDLRGVSESAALLGTSYLKLSRPHEAELYLTQAATIARQINAPELEASPLLSLSELRTAANDLDGAEIFARSSIEIAQKIGDPVLLSRAFHQLGTLAMRKRNVREAEQAFLTALKYSEGTSNTLSDAFTWLNLAGVYALKGDTVQTRYALENYKKLWQETGFPENQQANDWLAQLENS